MPDRGVRISKYLASAGVASRRHVDELIAKGRVTVNGKMVVLGQKIFPGDTVEIDGEEIRGSEDFVYIMLNKPPGYLSSCSDSFNRPTVLSLIKGVNQRLFPVGRLDMDACGLILLTNDGELAYLLTHPKHRVVKEYLVTVLGQRDEEKVRRMLSGVIVSGRKVKADYAKFLHGDLAIDGAKQRGTQGPLAGRLVVGVHEGEKHLVKNMCSAVGLRVVRLMRTRLGGLRLGSLKEGGWRHLTAEEVRALYIDGRRGLEGEYHGKRQD